MGTARPWYTELGHYHTCIEKSGKIRMGIIGEEFSKARC